MDTTEKALICILTAMLMLLTGLITYDVATRNVQEQAILKGYAEWKVNARGTEARFHWK